MSQNSEQTIARLKNGEKAIWGIMGPFFVSSRDDRPVAACDYDINLHSAKSLLRKKIIKRRIDENGDCEIILSRAENGP